MIESSIDELYISSWCRDDIKVETMGRPQMEVKPWSKFWWGVCKIWLRC